MMMMMMIMMMIMMMMTMMMMMFPRAVTGRLHSFLIWLVRSVVSVDRMRFVRGHLVRREDTTTNPEAGSGRPTAQPGAGRVDDARALIQFVDDYLRVDGVFLLRLIAHNTNGMASAEITLALWNAWNDRRIIHKEAEAGGLLTLPKRRPSVE